MLESVYEAAEEGRQSGNIDRECIRTNLAM